MNAINKLINDNNICNFVIFNFNIITFFTLISELLKKNNNK